MNISKKEKIIIALISAVIILFFIYRFIPSNNYEENNFEKVTSAENNSNNDLSVSAKEEDIYVHICGRVKNPGLIKVSANSRVVDAVEIAGGLYDDADLDKINLAKKLKDEDRIFIPKIGEESLDVAEEKNLEDENLSEIININIASKEELQTLPGIGPKMAENIIEFRESEEFKEIIDIMQVSGIGEKKFQDIKKFITVN